MPVLLEPPLSLSRDLEEEKDPSSSSWSSSMRDNIPMTPALLDSSSSTCSDIEKQEKGIDQHHHANHPHHRPPLTSSSKSNIPLSPPMLLLPPPPPPLLASSSRGRKCRTPTMSRNRKRQQHDPLGASLHSYRPRIHNHDEPTFRIRKKAITNNMSQYQTLSATSTSTSSSRRRGGESLRQRGGALRRSYSAGIKSASTLGRSNSNTYDDRESPDSPPPVDPQHLPSFSDDDDDDDYDSFDDDNYNYPTKKKNMPSKQRRRRKEFSSKIHNHQHLIQNAVSLSYCHHPQCGWWFGCKQRRWFLVALQVAVIVVLVVGVCIHSRHKLHTANEQLHVSQMEKSDILNQMKWLDTRSKQNLGGPNKALEHQKRQINAMQDHIRVLEQTIQENSKQELFRLLPSLSSSTAAMDDVGNEGIERDQLKSSGRTSHDGVLNVEITTTMEGKGPLIFQLWHNEMPYTALTWINQIQEGMWSNANMQLIDASWVDIHPPVAAGTKSKQPKRLAFRESPITDTDSLNQNDNPRRFVLGMRNIIQNQRQEQHPQQEEGEEEEQRIDNGNSMFVLTVHLEVGTCESDETESCFGELIGGFDQLTDMITMVDDNQGVAITSIQIQNHPITINGNR